MSQGRVSGLEVRAGPGRWYGVNFACSLISGGVCQLASLVASYFGPLATTSLDGRKLGIGKRFCTAYGNQYPLGGHRIVLSRKFKKYLGRLGKFNYKYL